MTTVTLEVTGAVPLGGRPPGARFTLTADAEGRPLDPYWRARLADEEAYACGAVAIVQDEAADPGALEPPAPPASRKSANRKGA